MALLLEVSFFRFAHATSLIFGMKKCRALKFQRTSLDLAHFHSEGIENIRKIENFHNLHNFSLLKFISSCFSRLNIMVPPLDVPFFRVAQIIIRHLDTQSGIALRSHRCICRAPSARLSRSSAS
jgi:hypothetical protein